MSGSLVALIAAAVLVFWAVGAYNRLVRLRAAVLRAFAALDNLLAVQPALIQASTPVEMDQQAGDEDGHGSQPMADWRGLVAAADRFARSLAAARSQPLQAQTMDALSTAQAELQRCWQGDATDRAVGSPLAGTVRARLQRQAELAIGPAQLQAEAVQAYNTAIAEFPALLLAQLFRFGPAVAFRAVELPVNTSRDDPA